MTDHTDIPVIIPSLEPDQRLLLIIKDLIQAGMKNIIVVNDGSGEKYDEIFRQAENEGARILQHSVNLGKGRALKTAFNYCLCTYKEFYGAITADSDGQHTAADIKKCAEALLNHREKLILGVRNFKNKDIPFRSKFGNEMTVFVLKCACGIKVSDTQTGLRAIPSEFMKRLLSVPGERFEFETNMLIEAREANIEIQEIPIETIYQKEEYSSHFNPIKDSIRIYRVFGKYIFSSSFSTVVDFLLFTLLVYQLKNILPAIYIFVATIMARVVSATINFIINRNVVFKSSKSYLQTFLKYSILCILVMVCSGSIVTILHNTFSLNELLAKVIVDTVLFLLNFVIQREIVF